MPIFSFFGDFFGKYICRNSGMYDFFIFFSGNQNFRDVKGRIILLKINEITYKWSK